MTSDDLVGQKTFENDLIEWAAIEEMPVQESWHLFCHYKDNAGKKRTKQTPPQEPQRPRNKTGAPCERSKQSKSLNVTAK